MRLGVAMFVLVTACGAAAPGPRVAVLPEVWATSAPESAAPAAPRIAQTLRAQQLATVDEGSVRDALAPEGASCLEDLACVRRVGERVHARKVVTLQLAELGQTVAVQLTLFDVQRGAREATLREIVNPNEPPRLAATLDLLGERVARQTAGQRRGSRRWYWLGAAGVAVGGVVATAVLLATMGGNDPDTIIVPP